MSSARVSTDVFAPCMYRHTRRNRMEAARPRHFTQSSGALIGLLVSCNPSQHLTKDRTHTAVLVFVKPHQQHNHHCLMITCGLAHCCFDVTPAGQHAHAEKEVLDPVSRLQLCLLCRVLRAQQNCPWLHADVLALWQTYSFSVLILVSHTTLFPQLMHACLGGSHVKNVLQGVRWMLLVL